MLSFTKHLTTAAMLLAATLANAQVSITSLGDAGKHTQDFNTLANTGTTAPFSGSGLTDWLFQENGTGADANYRISTGSLSNGDTYSFGSTGAADRALGSVGSNAINPAQYGVRIANNTGATVTCVSVKYTGEQWRNGGSANMDSLEFYYAPNITSLSAGAWTPGFPAGFVKYRAGNFNAPINTGAAAALDGNLPANQVAKTFSINVTIPNGEEIFIGWQDKNDAGGDHGLAVDDLEVSFHAPNAGTAVLPNTEVCLNSTTTLDLYTLISGNDAGGTWSDLNGAGVAFDALTATFIPNNLTTGAGNYSFKYTASSGACTDEETVTVIVNELPIPVINPTATLLGCSPTSADLEVTGGIFNSYDWSHSVTGDYITVNPTTTTTYTVTVSNSFGCTNTTSQTITFDNTPPSVTTGADFITVNCTNPTATLTPNGAGYVWDSGDMVSPTSATTYTVTATGANGCTTTATIAIAVDNTPPSVTTGADFTTVNCTNPTATLTPNGAGYVWDSGDMVSPTSATTYTVTATGANGCTTTATIAIAVDNTPPSITTTNTALDCFGNPAILGVTEMGTYEWSNGETTQTISVTNTNTYTVTLTAANGCTNTATAQATTATCGISTTLANCVNASNPAISDGIGGEWLDIRDNLGNILASVKDDDYMGTINGSYLPPVYPLATSGYYNTIGRIINITPTFQPFNAPINVRLYFTAAEFAAVQASDPTLITINDLIVTKDPMHCIEYIYNGVTVPIIATGSYGTGYFIEVQVTEFSSFFIHGSQQMPLSLTQFSGKQTAATNTLSWTTATEQNTSHFSIETSTTAAVWNELGKVAAAKNSTTTQNYSFIDEKPATRSYYRLKMVDVDGTYTYSNTITVQRNSKGNVTLQPNPAKDNLTIVLTDNTPTQIRIFNALGQVVLTETLQSQTTALDISTLSQGTYFLRVENGTAANTQSFIKIAR